MLNFDKRTDHEAADIVDEYGQLADIYDTKWSFYLEATTRQTMDRLRLGPNDCVLDVGCGTGILLDRLCAGGAGDAQGAVRLAGMDPMARMLDVARRRLPACVALCQGWARRLPFAADTFDVVVSCSVFHFLHEPVVALNEMHRVLRPGGRLVLTDWCADYLSIRLCELYLRCFNRAHFKAYRRRECRRLLEDAGQVDVHVEQYKINWCWGLMTATSTKPAA